MSGSGSWYEDYDFKPQYKQAAIFGTLSKTLNSQLLSCILDKNVSQMM